MPDETILPKPAPSGNGEIQIRLHHVTPEVAEYKGTHWINFEAGQVKVTIFVTPHEALALAVQIVAKFGPIPVPSAEVSDISVDGRDT